MTLEQMIKKLTRITSIYQLSMFLVRKDGQTVEIIRVYPDDGYAYRRLTRHDGKWKLVGDAEYRIELHDFFETAKLGKDDEDWRVYFSAFRSAMEDAQTMCRLLGELEQYVSEPDIAELI